MKLLFLAALLLMFPSCSKSEQGKENSNSYRVLIGESFKPTFDDLKKGDEFGENKNIMSFSEGEFGLLNVKIVGGESGDFKQGGVVLNVKPCTLVFKGDLTKDLKVVVLESVRSGLFKVVQKNKIKSGQGIELEINVE